MDYKHLAGTHDLLFPRSSLAHFYYRGAKKTTLITLVGLLACILWGTHHVLSRDAATPVVADAILVPSMTALLSPTPIENPLPSAKLLPNTTTSLAFAPALTTQTQLVAPPPLGNCGD